MKWNIVGIQGNLLNQLIMPIFIDYMIIENKNNEIVRIK